MNRLWVWGVVALLAAGAAGWLLFADDPGQARGRQDLAEVREELRKDDPVQVQREKLTLAVIGANAELVEARPGPEGWTIGIELPRVPPSERHMFEKVMNILTEVDRSGVPIQHATVVLRTDDLKDVYGNTLKDVVVGRLQLSGAVFRRINWHGFDPGNVARLADEWWLHEEVTTVEQEEQTAGASGKDGGGGGGDSGGDGGGGGSGGAG